MLMRHPDAFFWLTYCFKSVFEVCTIALFTWNDIRSNLLRFFCKICTQFNIRGI
jgi:hypothetical protein